ncbi:FadR/GntR family transcriptional regulator [Frankia sp. Cas3]|uniref:FadR/GntR family transcriptional regulator n=1 Tax=Frankia sp. Cas3 TaxID=3073926 RepID=UPI002AD2BBF8|nr:FCD domain-containing protein [Frankia sp. Cas3]
MALLNATEIATTGPVGISAPAKPAEAAGTGGAVIGEGRIGRQVRVPKTAELVAAHLRRQIVRGELVEGDALPPEAVLMEQFGVSRPTLREAFRVLESEALISVRRGAHGGARVHTPNGDVAARYAALVLEHRGTTLADIHQARALIEPPCIRQIAERHTDDDLTELRAALTAVEAADDNHSQLQAADTDFRGLLIELAGNQTLLVLAGMLRHIVSLAQGSGSVPDNTPATPATPGAPGAPGGAGPAGAANHRPHRELVALIEAGQAAAAEDLWRRHLLATNPFAGHDQATVLDLLGGVPTSGR